MILVRPLAELTLHEEDTEKEDVEDQRCKHAPQDVSLVSSASHLE